MDAAKNYGFLTLAVLLAVGGIYLSGSGQKGYDLMAFLAAAVFFCAQIIMVNTRMGVLTAALLAMGCNAYLLSGKFSSTGFSACQVDQYWDCSKINDLPESELFGVPITLFGVGFYGGLAIASLLGQKGPRFHQVNGLFAFLSLIFSAWLGWVAVQAGAGCIMCVTIYACNVLLLWAAFKGQREIGSSLFDGVDKVFGAPSLWVITSVFALTTLVGTSAWSSQKEATAIPIVKPTPDGGTADVDIDKLRGLYGAPKGTIELDGTEPRLGKRDAPIRIVEFADYACPHCAQAAPMLKEIVKNNPEVQLLFKAFPLSGACNPVMQGEDGVERCKAAMAAECAGDQGRYFDLSSQIFKNIGYNSDDDLAFMAKEVELDFEAWVSCMQNPATIEAVVADARGGAAAQVQGTPSMFVHGLVDGGWVEMLQGPPGLQALLDAKQNGIVLPSP